MARKKADEEQSQDIGGGDVRQVELDKFRKKYDNVRIVFGEEIDNIARRDNRIRTGNPALDYVTNGGLVRGGAIQIYGEENVGKSLSGHIASAYVQNVLAEDVLWVVAMGEKFDRRLSELTGGQYGAGLPAKIGFMEASSSEDLIEASTDFVATGRFGLVIVDSLAALRPKDEVTKTMDQNLKMMGQPNLVNRFISKMASAQFHSPNTAVIILNQARDTHEQEWNGFQMVKAKPHAPGGRYSRHMALADVFMQKEGVIREITGDKAKDKNARVIGRSISYEGMKGKVTGPHGRSVEADIYTESSPHYRFGPGQIDLGKALAEVAIRQGLLTQSGTWISFDSSGKRLQGRSQWYDALNDDLELYNLLDAAVYDSYFQESAQ